ncbi:hypothetical protein BU16DRAFT_538609 [Lophium mytilinum]|uniref:Uncharacterized protein n=1 Tax=Lophium mytilinum TaxID=390894 RepID=A0A6A6QV35_9PEZI|nr:hypothetical protein BU16DRAFT_538609 [Lophium mytilinum]
MEVIQILLENGGDPNGVVGIYSGTYRSRALQYAIETEELPKVEQLKGADVNEPPASRAGGTALRLAAIGGYTGTALLLLEHGADVNAAPSMMEGRMAFEAAAENGRIEMILLLVQKGADLLSIESAQYKRPLDFEENSGQIAVCNMVQRLYETKLSEEQLQRMFLPDGQETKIVHETEVDESEIFSNWVSFSPRP